VLAQYNFHGAIPPSIAGEGQKSDHARALDSLHQKALVPRACP
jgi:hypothetical protein